MSTRLRRGTTLIELVVALALFAAFLYAATAIAGAALGRSAAQKEVLAVQGAFRSACEMIVQDARGASWPDDASVVPPAYTGEKGSNPYIVVPLSGSLDDQLAVTLPVDGVMHLYRYYMGTISGAQYMVKADYLLNSSTAVPDPFYWTANGSSLTLLSTQPITSPLTQLTRAYFVNQAGTVTLLFVADMKLGRAAQQVTYCSNLFVRNYVRPK